MNNLKVEHNSFALYYRSPSGAVPRGSSILLRIQVMMENRDRLDRVLLCWKTDNDERLNCCVMKQESSSDSPIYSHTLTVPDKPQLLWYYFKLMIDDEIYYYGKQEDGYGGIGQLYQDIPPSYQVTVYQSGQTPDWFKKAIIYQIFVDRFYNGNQDQKVLNPKKNSLIQSHWCNDPVYVFDEEGKINRWSFFGGNLAGVKKKLPYLKKLGINLIYFNPIFKAASDHKYDTGDYHKIDEMYGDKNIFEELIEEAAALGIYVILDGVFSHTGSDSIYFNKDNNYDNQGAYQTQDSPYYEWYRFKNYPDEYECWWGMENLPEVDELNPSYQDFIIYNKDSVLQYWMKTGIKGWRLDVADELPEEFIEKFKKTMKDCDINSVLVGEVWEDASNKVSYDKRRRYLLGERLDSVTNYPLRNIMLDFITGKEVSQTTHRALMTLYENYPSAYFYSTMNLLGSHDVKRILTELKDKLMEKQLQSVDEIALKQLKLLILWQMTFPGVPTIYYGDEAGLEGGRDPDNRRTYPWGDENEELLTWYQEMISIRQNYDIFTTGTWNSLPVNEDVYGYIRKIEEDNDVFGNDGENNTALILINRNTDKKITLNLDMDKWIEGTIYDFIDNQTVKLKGGQLQVTLAPLSARLFVENRWPLKLKQQRKAGILLHLTSLPSPYGIGDMGENALKFIDFLEETGQTYWQVLPLNPPSHGNSPYQCYSSFAGNVMLINPDIMVKKGWLQEKDLDPVPEFNKNQVDFTKVSQYKHKIFKKAWHNFQINREYETEVYQNFVETHQYWLDDYCLFMALKEHFQEQPWNEWPDEIAWRRPEALVKYREKLQEKIGYHKFLQFVFFVQWQQLKEYALKKKVKIMGDLPIFVGHNSSDVWANPDLFKLKKDGSPAKVAGVPPDAFSDTGQRWGNPVYCWDKMSSNDYQWWQQRFKVLEKLVDIVRIDHFRGFEAYWEIPAEEETAVNGRWVQGPGQEFFEVVLPRINDLSLVAEDLGYITPEVEELKMVNDFPGMKVMQFMIEPDEDFKLPFHQYNNYLYSGTHDNKTLWQWYQDYYTEEKKIEEKQQNILQTRGREQVCWDFIEKLYNSPALKVIIPLQDILSLGAEARMNIPGTATDNWKWRFYWEQISKDIKSKLKRFVSEYNRR